MGGAERVATLPVETCKELIQLPYIVRRLFVPVSPQYPRTHRLMAQFWWGWKYSTFWKYCSHAEVRKALAAGKLTRQNLTFVGTA